MDYRRFFGNNSPLAETVRNFAPRPQQQSMAEAVGDALQVGQTLVVEAGTGIGKTFAYLVPALTSGQRVIISTGTRNLQDQLFNRDLPTVTRAIGRPVKVALLKGRANYLCLYRMQQEQQQDLDDHYLDTVVSWSRTTASGDRAELTSVPEDAAIWPRVTSTVDNCLGSECPRYDQCFVVAARRKAQDADVVVVNHHLLLADFAIREEGFGELLPTVDACIVDEAHQLPEVAAQFFGVTVSTRQLHNLCRDTVAELLAHGESEEHWRAIPAALDKAVADATLLWSRHRGRQLWPADPAASETLGDLGEHLGALSGMLEPLAESAPGLAQCRERACELLARIEQFDPAHDTAGEGLRWIDGYRRGFSLHLTPFNVSERIGTLLTQVPATWVFTSATLAVGEDFSHFLGRIGVREAATLKLDSPFDFERNALLYIPNNIPDPGHPGFTRAVCAEAVPAIRAAGGGAFMLFTSHRALQEAAGYLGDRAEFDYPLLVQGSAPRARLIEEFRADGNAVLLGTASFWEGVDVRGTALRLVVIDKLPFASPGDPLMQARLEAIRRAGQNPFSTYQLPQAVLTLKQGVGRLIRDHDDYGVAMLCDPRLKSKSYGRVFIRSLPPMPFTDDMEEVQRFFSATAPSGQQALL